MFITLSTHLLLFTVHPPSQSPLRGQMQGKRQTSQSFTSEGGASHSLTRFRLVWPDRPSWQFGFNTTARTYFSLKKTRLLPTQPNTTINCLCERVISTVSATLSSQLYPRTAIMASNPQSVNGSESEFEFIETPKAPTPTFEKFEECGVKTTSVSTEAIDSPTYRHSFSN